MSMRQKISRNRAIRSHSSHDECQSNFIIATNKHTDYGFNNKRKSVMIWLIKIRLIFSSSCEA